VRGLARQCGWDFRELRVNEEVNTVRRGRGNLRRRGDWSGFRFVVQICMMEWSSHAWPMLAAAEMTC
jgi:hypothetical protein